MDCGHSASLSTNNMENFENFEVEIGEVGASNDERDQALLATDSDVGTPDEGNGNKGVGEPYIINNLTDEIGGPEQEHTDAISKRPIVGTATGKEDESGAYVGEPVEDSRHYIQIAEEDNSAGYSKAPDEVDSSVKDGGILEIEDAPADDGTVPRMSTKYKVQDINAKASCDRKSRRGRERKQRKKAPDAHKIRIRGDSYDTKDSTTLVKNNRPSHGGDALKRNDNSCNPVGASKKERTRVKKGKTNKYKKKFKEENVKAPEGDTPGTHNLDKDGGSDGGGIKINHRAWWTSPFDFLLLMWTLLKPGADENFKTPEGYPVLDPEGYPVLDPEGYPVLDPEGYPVLDLEGYRPDKHSSDGDDIEIKHSAWTSLFGISNRKSIFLLSMCTLLNPAAGAAIPPSSVSYQCCTFETLDSKISFPDVNFTIKWGAEDICTHKPYAVSLDCTKGTRCFIINKQIVKLCNKFNITNFFMVHGVNGATIHSSNPEELSPETVESLRIVYARTSPTTSASPDRTSSYMLPVQTLEARSRVLGIAAAVVAIIAIVLMLLCYFGFPRCSRCYKYPFILLEFIIN